MEIVFSKHVRLKDTLTDDYGRVLSSVFVGRTNINEQLAREGFARSTSAVYKAAAAVAKTQKIGIYTCRTEPVGDCVIKGNVRAGEKIYHVPTCDNYAQVIVDEAYGDHWFCTEDEAVAAGFTKAAGCRK